MRAKTYYDAGAQKAAAQYGVKTAGIADRDYMHEPRKPELPAWLVKADKFLNNRTGYEMAGLEGGLASPFFGALGAYEAPHGESRLLHGVATGVGGGAGTFAGGTTGHYAGEALASLLGLNPRHGAGVGRFIGGAWGGRTGYNQAREMASGIHSHFNPKEQPNE